MQSFPTEPSTEEELPMLRSRLASLAVACGLLVTLSGCCSFCEDGRLFPRLFKSNYQGAQAGSMFGHRAPECECHQGPHMPGIFDTASKHGPVLMTPASNPTMPIPITNVPTNQPPQIFKLPQAAPTPYIPTP